MLHIQTYHLVTENPWLPNNTTFSAQYYYPRCPSGTSFMWQGYSLLNVMGNQQTQGQDLGATGSCMRKFTSVPYLLCNLNDKCEFSLSKDYSYWLSATQPLPLMVTTITGPEIEKYVSK
ncbi:hypothetical protein Pmani_004825 [Petrolisthes manimaculis]|uniref:Collagen IV NC1 domain-containing protein n=1 Tax=Petrolisthes manimaculis TaxID=1843537 RepID=A0AAE1QE31_9EUCA|nr:hypothetical protein Pmani_004825 [Petrolisthes manimaculis]